MAPSKTRLLICTTSRSIYGGVENIVADLCNNLPKHGIYPILGLVKGCRFNDPDRYRAAFPNLSTVEIDGTKGTRQARIEGLLKTIKHVRPDIVLIARVFDAYHAVSIIKKKLGRPRLAVTIQAYEPHYIYDAWIYRKHIDMCVTSGELIRYATHSYSRVPLDRLVSIPGGVRPPTVPVLPRCSGKTIRLGYVGRLDPGQKRVFDIVPFIKGLEDSKIPFKLDIVGTGPGEKELRRLLAEWERYGKVKFHGWLDNQVLYKNIFPKMDVILHFAHTEGVTIAPREALIHGVVPIISQFTGLRKERQFLDGVNALTFPVGDINAAIHNVIRLTHNQALLKKLSTNAMNSQEGKYSFDGSIAAWANAFYECLNRKPTTGELPKSYNYIDGRLARLGLHPWIAQRIRDLLGKHHLHTDGGGEWPTGSGMMTKEDENNILDIANKIDI